MLRIGLIGAESTHAEAYIREIHSHTRNTACRIEYLWGETENLAERLIHKIEQDHEAHPDYEAHPLELTRNIQIVDRQEAMCRKVDAVIIAQRHGAFHLDSAKLFLADRIPVFIDKPLCISSERGDEYLQQAEKNGIAVTSFSILQFQKSTEIVKKRFAQHSLRGSTRTFHIYGPANIIPEYGGLYFYGIHQVLLAGELFGRSAVQVDTQTSDNEIIAVLKYQHELQVVLHFVLTGQDDFSVSWDSLDGDDEEANAGMINMLNNVIAFDDNMFREPVRVMLNMFRTGIEPFTHKDLLWPIRIMEAVAESLGSWFVGY